MTKSLRSAIDLIFVAAPKLMGGISLVVINILLMKQVGVESFGAYSICLVLMGLLSEGLCGAAIDLGVMRMAPLYALTDPEKAQRFESAGLRLKLQIVGALSLVLLLASYPLKHYLFHGYSGWWLIPQVTIAALAITILTSALLHLQIRGRFATYGLVDATQMGVKFGGIGLLLFITQAQGTSPSVESVLCWFAIGPVVALGICAFKITWNEAPVHPTNHPREELLRVVKWYLITLLLTSLTSKADTFLLSLLTGLNEVGVFSGALTISSIPLMLGSYLGIIFSPKVMPHCKAGTFKQLLTELQLALLLSSVAIYAIIFFYRAYLTEFLLPVAFRPSATLILILLPATLAGMTSYPLAVTFLMFVSPRFFLWLECILLPPFAIAYVIMITNYGALGAAIVTAILGITKTVIAQVMAFRWSQRPIIEGTALSSD